MRRTSHLLFVLTLAAIAVPLIPFLLFGTRLDRIVGQWLDPLPSVPVMAGLELAVLAADLLLPVPSSVVATLGGAHLGIALGTCCAWLGMTAGAAAGWWLGRVAGGQALSRLRPEERIFLEQQERRFGPLFIVLTRPLPLFAEAAAIFAGAAGMRQRDFLLAAASGNLVIAFAWSFLGAMGHSQDTVQSVLIWSLLLPVAVTWLVVRQHLQSSQSAL